MPTVQPVEDVQLSRLIPYANNPRRRTRAQIRKLAGLISRYGFTSPVLIDEDNVILAGHGRLEAARSLGMVSVPSIRIINLSKAEKNALRIADNRISEESSWNPELLSLEMKGLLELGFEMQDTSFDTIELDLILAADDASAPVIEKPLPPPPDVPVSRSGDKWKLGRHSLVCGDARDSWTFARLLGHDKADMVFMDPPWNVPIEGHVSGNGRAKHDEFRMASGEMTLPEFQSFLTTILTQTRDWSTNGSLHYVCIDWRGIADVITAGRQLFSRLMNVAVWAKPNAGMGSFYRSQHEMVVIFKRGDAAHVNNVQLGRLGRYRSNLWQYPGGSGFSKSRLQDLEDHPTVKPRALVADAIRDASAPNALVLDPFGGAGTTLLAAEITGRRAALIEIEPKFVDVTLRRFQDQTGQEPLLLPDMTPLSEVRRQRSLGNVS